MAIPVIAIGWGSLAIFAVDKLTDLVSETEELTKETGSFIKTSGVALAVVVVGGIILYKSLDWYGIFKKNKSAF